MRQILVTAFVFGVLLGRPVLTSAQEEIPQDRPANFVIGGGYTAPNSEVRDHLGDGYNFNIGFQVNVNRMIGVEGLYGFNGLGDKRLSLPVSVTPFADGTPTDFFADMNMQYGTANVVIQRPYGRIRPYALTGGGIYYRPVTVSTPSVGYVPGYCDPWWYVCYPGGWVETDRIIGDRSSTDFGMDVGGGVNFDFAFAEVRYHYIWGPTIESDDPALTTEARDANGQFFTVTFGFRY
jgi:opacity protein-like surface antigen